MAIARQASRSAVRHGLRWWPLFSFVLLAAILGATLGVRSVSAQAQGTAAAPAAGNCAVSQPTVAAEDDVARHHQRPANPDRHVDADQGGVEAGAGTGVADVVRQCVGLALNYSGAFVTCPSTRRQSPRGLPSWSSRGSNDGGKF